MPATPYALRGLFYTTSLFARCPDFHQCRSCLRCNHYNRHSAQCVACESVKPDTMATCSCSDDRQEYIIRLEELIGRPMYDPNAEAKSVELMQTCDNPYGEHVVNNLVAKELF
jgi:hypothetical protein